MPMPLLPAEQPNKPKKRRCTVVVACVRAAFRKIATAVHARAAAAAAA